LLLFENLNGRRTFSSLSGKGEIELLDFSFGGSCGVFDDNDDNDSNVDVDIGGGDLVVSIVSWLGSV
jgi:hypothetical protein